MTLLGALGVTFAVTSHPVYADPFVSRGITIAPELSGDDYKRWPSWRDADGDCQDTRQEVLIDESVIEPVLSPSGCRVLSGQWDDPYTGLTFTDPGDVDIDHLVPLKEAHVSGGAAWSRDKKRAYANSMEDPNHLIAVDDATNQRKRDKDPAEWTPPVESYHCAYIEAWLDVKGRWGLSVDLGEAVKILEILEECDE